MLDPLMQGFLTDVGWGAATATPLAGDASSRRYVRLKHQHQSAILMDAGPNSGEDLTRFAMIAHHLRGLSLSAPNVLAQADDRFLLLEDLGDRVFASEILAAPRSEISLYQTALDALSIVQDNPPPQKLPPYGPSEMGAATDLAFIWYAPDLQPHKAELTARLADLLKTHLAGPLVMCLRDFHAENLIWLPERNGAAQAGLLDFQDAVLCHPAYDIASLLIDARRDVSVEARENLISYAANKSGQTAQRLALQIALCSAQRNLRILGIFARLASRDNKPHYADLLPRVWSNFVSDLSNPILSPIRNELLKRLPSPTPAYIAALKDRHVSN
ncbi:MAG: phosphotransferase [Litoreibacter sp.]